MSHFKPLREELKNYMDKQQIDAIYQSYQLAKKAHDGQTRYTGEPYITHPIAVACILAEIRMDQPTIMAAIMHDVIEDTRVDKETIIQEFGREVADLVDGVSKLTQIKFESRAEAQAENFRKMILAMAKDTRVILVKLSDRLHNMRTLKTLPQSKKGRIAKETLGIYAPIANRLGMHVFRVELEDLGFAALYPTRYNVLENAVKKARGNRKEIVSVIEKSLRSCIDQFDIPNVQLKGRKKHLFSIYKKMRDRRIPFSEIMDIYAFRIVVDKVDECYRVLGAVHNLYKPIPQRFKDYIAIPKANGYQSLHTTLFGPYGLPIEIQIRTYQMERMAENGISAHWLYKSEAKDFSEAQLRAREWIKDVMEMQQSAGTSIEFVENVKIDLFPDEAYIFTPKGQIIKLPAGATGVDFAYAVHSDVGNSCVAIKIDRRLSPLSTALESGQTVEVITAPGARPNTSWLNFVVTGKARSNIRHYLKTQRRAESMKLGKRLLSKAIKGLGGRFSMKQLAPIVKAYQLNSADDLLAEVGFGNRVPALVAKQMLEAQQITVGDIDKDADVMTIKGTEGMVVNFAECCRPIPGDPIIGELSKGQGLIVHADQCPRLIRRRDDPTKCVPLRWEDEVEGDFVVDIRVEIENRRGILATLALSIAEAESNIANIVAQDHDGRFFLVKLTLAVRDRKHLARVIRRIRRIEGITRITRFKEYADE